jgi:NTP pyrophosphatase (non-canonical NTP hydrolase)
MNPTEYIMKSARTDGDKEHYKEVAERAFACAELVHYTDGLVTESGEIKDMMKKHIAYGAELDFVNLREEIGDLFWYIARICDLQNWTFEEIMDININKLQARYPEKFTLDSAVNRDLENERKILEGCRHEN